MTSASPDAGVAEEPHATGGSSPRSAEQHLLIMPVLVTGATEGAADDTHSTLRRPLATSRLARLSKFYGTTGHAPATAIIPAQCAVSGNSVPGPGICFELVTSRIHIGDMPFAGAVGRPARCRRLPNAMPPPRRRRGGQLPDVTGSQDGSHSLTQMSYSVSGRRGQRKPRVTALAGRPPICRRPPARFRAARGRTRPRPGPARHRLPPAAAAGREPGTREQPERCD